MVGFLLKKILSYLITLFLIITVTFVLMKTIPGDPFSQDKVLPPAILEAMRDHYGLNDPLIVQYWRYLKSIAFLDFGPSLTYSGQHVSSIIAEGFPTSATLGFNALLLSIFLGTTFGSIAATHVGKWQDRLAMIFGVLGLSMPSFLIATGLQYIFAIKLGWLPIARWDGPWHWILPALSLALLPAAFIARLTRSSLLDVWHQDYIKVAKAKGLSPRAILFRHALKNALLPVISYLGPMSANVLTGTFVVERVFSIPGLGHWLIGSINNRDYPVIMGITIFYSAVLLTAVLLVDIVYVILDPRLRTNLYKK